MKGKKALFCFLAMVLTMAAALGGCSKGDGKGTKEKKKTSSENALEEINEIPEDGIITKEQFASVAGEDRQIQFVGHTEDGIEYVWAYDASKIKNPEEQNLKLELTEDNLDGIKKQANDASNALLLTMHGKGVICAPTLTVKLSKSWESDTGLLLKEQGGKLAKMSDVTIEKTGGGKEDEEAGESEKSQDGAKADGDASGENGGQTILTMQVTSLDGECYVVGGIAGVQNKGAQKANSLGNAANETAAGSQSPQSGGSGQQGAGGGDAIPSDSGGEDVENDVETQQTSHICTISISCATILDNMDSLKEEKSEFVPANGQILAPSEVEFEPGETVHDLLKRVCKEAGIHMESSYTPMYGSAYVEGINQLYEFDCGELSGWMYNVNGWFPNYGCSQYELSDGDVVNWVYTCNLGKDVGDNSMY